MDIDYTVAPGVFMRTVQDARGIHYRVYVDDQQRWYKYVRFGKSVRNRAGGPAFVEASREQEKMARALADENDR